MEAKRVYMCKFFILSRYLFYVILPCFNYVRHQRMSLYRFDAIDHWFCDCAWMSLKPPVQYISQTSMGRTLLPPLVNMPRISFRRYFKEDMLMSHMRSGYLRTFITEWDRETPAILLSFCMFKNESTHSLVGNHACLTR